MQTITLPATFVRTNRMKPKAVFPGLLLLSLVTTVAHGDSFLPKTDNEIAALDVRTGKLLWTYQPPHLSDAHFEVYDQGLVVYPSYSGNDRTKSLFLHPEKGIPVKPFNTEPSKCLARSATFSPQPKIELDNGWTLSGFSSGYTMVLKFADREKGEVVWQIDTGSYPHVVRCWKDFVFYAFSYLSHEGVLYAYKAGANKATWKVDLNQIVKGRERPLTRMIFQVIEDVIYLEADEHIFAFDPSTGKLLWHRDLAKDTGVPFAGGFFGGGLNLAVFAKSDNILVISFEKRVVALDLQTMKCLWHLEPDTFPHCPFPITHAGKVFLTSGKNRKLHTFERPTGVDVKGHEKGTSSLKENNSDI